MHDKNGNVMRGTGCSPKPNVNSKISSLKVNLDCLSHRCRTFDHVHDGHGRGLPKARARSNLSGIQPLSRRLPGALGREDQRAICDRTGY